MAVSGFRFIIGHKIYLFPKTSMNGAFKFFVRVLPSNSATQGGSLIRTTTALKKSSDNAMCNEMNRTSGWCTRCAHYGHSALLCCLTISSSGRCQTRPVLRPNQICWAWYATGSRTVAQIIYCVVPGLALRRLLKLEAHAEGSGPSACQSFTESPPLRQLGRVEQASARERLVHNRLQHSAHGDLQVLDANPKRRFPAVTGNVAGQI